MVTRNTRLTTYKHAQATGIIFTAQELKTWQNLIKAHYVFSSTSTMLGKDFEYLAAEFFNTSVKNDKSIFDIAFGGFGYSLKTLQTVTANFVRVIIRRVSIPKTDDILVDGKSAYANLVKHYQESCDIHNIDMPRILILLRQAKEHSFTIWQEPYILPDPNNIEWRSYRSNVQGYLDGNQVFTWNRSGDSQFSQVFTIPTNAQEFDIDWRPLTFEDKFTILKERNY